jgi:hypothetical protein
MKGRMLLLTITAPVILLAVLLVVPGAAKSGGTFKATLIGYEEVPSLSTAASGEFRAKLRAGPTIDYTLSYANIQGASAAHIHLGQRGVNGGVSAFLCGGGDKPPCPPTGGEVSGTIDAADVIGPTDQGIAPGEIQELIDAMLGGFTYANVHTSAFPGGEIRGQIS